MCDFRNIGNAALAPWPHPTASRARRQGWRPGTRQSRPRATAYNPPENGLSNLPRGAFGVLEPPTLRSRRDIPAQPTPANRRALPRSLDLHAVATSEGPPHGGGGLGQTRKRVRSQMVAEDVRQRDRSPRKPRGTRMAWWWNVHGTVDEDRHEGPARAEQRKGPPPAALTGGRWPASRQPCGECPEKIVSRMIATIIKEEERQRLARAIRAEFAP